MILSACNTAAGAATSAEALSGLARAFIYAQARALLVSHWAVYSDATVKLITAAIREMARDPKVGRAEALRRSMLALIDKGEPQRGPPGLLGAVRGGGGGCCWAVAECRRSALCFPRHALYEMPQTRAFSRNPSKTMC